MKKDIKPFLFFSIIASLLVGHLANRTALIFEGLTGNLVENINAAIDAIIPALQNNPFMIGTSKTALISGAIGAACVWRKELYARIRTRLRTMGDSKRYKTSYRSRTGHEYSSFGHRANKRPKSKRL